jgi:hypothetical protein
LTQDIKIKETYSTKGGADSQCGHFMPGITTNKANTISKTANLRPDPHILYDPDKMLKLARMNGHKITIRTDGTCESYFIVTSLGATPNSIGAARLVYNFIDEDSKTIGRWDVGVCPVECGVMKEPRNPKGRYDGNLYERIVAVEC